MSLEETFTPEKSFNHTRFLPPLKNRRRGLWESNWFGEFMEILKMDGFIITLMGGYLPCRAQTKEFGYGFDDLGWLWTSSDIHPFLYSEKKKNWLFIGLQSGQQNLFYDYENKDWCNELH